MNRRFFLKSALSASAVAAGIGAGLLTPNMVLADIPTFSKMNDSIKASLANATEGNFKFKAPKIAENGAVVPVEVNATKLSNVSQIAIYVDNNVTNLACVFNLSGAVGFASTRIKMLKSSPVNAVVVADGKTTVVTREVKVTVGGCGG